MLFTVIFCTNSEGETVPYTHQDRICLYYVSFDSSRWHTSKKMAESKKEKSTVYIKTLVY